MSCRHSATTCPFLYAQGSTRLHDTPGIVIHDKKQELFERLAADGGASAITQAMLLKRKVRAFVTACLCVEATPAMLAVCLDCPTWYPGLCCEHIGIHSYRTRSLLVFVSGHLYCCVCASVSVCQCLRVCVSVCA